MKNLRQPAIIMAALVIGFLFLLGTAFHVLPDRVASHFDAAGYPNGWTDRQGFILLMGGLGLVLPLFFVVLFLFIQLAPGLFRQAQSQSSGGDSSITFQYLIRRSFWFASMTLCFIAAVQALIIEANASTPPRLQMTTLTVVVSGFAVGVLFWAASLLYHFFRGRRAAQPVGNPLAS